MDTITTTTVKSLLRWSSTSSGHLQVKHSIYIFVCLFQKVSPITFTLVYNIFLKGILGSGALPGKMLLVRNIENKNKIDTYTWVRLG